MPSKPIGSKSRGGEVRSVQDSKEFENGKQEAAKRQPKNVCLRTLTSDVGPDTVINQNQQPFQSPLQSENLMPFDSEEEYEFKDTTKSTVGYRL